MLNNNCPFFNDDNNKCEIPERKPKKCPYLDDEIRCPIVKKMANFYFEKYFGLI